VPIPLPGFRSILQKHRDSTEQPGIKPSIRQTETGHCQEDTSTQPPRSAHCSPLPVPPPLPVPAAAQDGGFKPLTLLLADVSQIHLTWVFVCAPLSLHNSRCSPLPRCLVNKKETACPLLSPYVKAYDSPTADGTRQCSPGRGSRSDGVQPAASSTLCVHGRHSRRALHGAGNELRAVPERERRAKRGC